MAFLFVKAYYGPCDTFNNCTHKPQLLLGLVDNLQKKGFRVNLVPVDFINYCMLEMCGHEVFRCNLKYLKFNTATDRDLVARRAVEAVMTSAIKFRRARACLWLWAAIDNQLFRRSEYGPRDYWPIKVDFTELANTKECLECCNILTTRRTDNDDKEVALMTKDE